MMSPTVAAQCDRTTSHRYWTYWTTGGEVKCKWVGVDNKPVSMVELMFNSINSQLKCWNLATVEACFWQLVHAEIIELIFYVRVTAYKATHLSPYYSAILTTLASMWALYSWHALSLFTAVYKKIGLWSLTLNNVKIYQSAPLVVGNLKFQKLV